MKGWTSEYISAHHAATIAAVHAHYAALAMIWPSQKSSRRRTHSDPGTSYIHIVLDVPADPRARVRGIRLHADGSWEPMVFGTQGYLMPSEWRALL